MKTLDTDIVIAGAGITGTTLAHLLSRQGTDCLLLDTGSGTAQDRQLNYDPRALSITPASARILSSVNIWHNLPRESLGRYHRIHVWDENSQGELHFDCADIGEPVLGYIIEQSILQNVLSEAAAYNTGINCQAGSVVEQVSNQEDFVEITLDNGSILRARLLVAADGANSNVRKLSGLEISRHEYNQQAVACIVQTSLQHENTARQRFLADGPLAFLPMASASSCGIVWSTRPDHAQALLELSDDEFMSRLGSAFEFRLGEITGCQPRVSFRLNRANAEHYIKGRCVLVGDAAHTIHPMAGMGANMGLLDVATLAELAGKAMKAGRDPGSRSVLRRYERWRRLENSQLIMAVEAIRFLFEKNSEPVNRARAFGLQRIDNWQFIKNRIMRYATGLAGDIPAVVREASI